ncbi:GHKL domain-containing protein [Patescibacteria group bacterium]|nr:GHKL domain-containing protein [Patescibacteria group bacterium]
MISDFFPLISAVFVFILGATIYLKGKKERVNRLFFLHSLAITNWLVGTFFLFQNITNPSGAIFWDRIVYIGVVLIPALMLDFCLTITKNRKGKIPRKVLFLGYCISILFLILSRTDLFVADVFNYEWGVHTQARIFHHFFLIYFSIYVLIGFGYLWRYFNKVKNRIERERIKYVLIAFLVLFTVGPIAFLPAYNIGIYPFSYLAGLAFSVILFRAILKFKLFDVRIRLQKIVNGFLSLLLILPFCSILWFLAWQVLKLNIYLCNAIAICFSAVSFLVLYNYISKALLGRFFSRKFYKFQKSLENLLKEASEVLDLGNVSRLVLRGLSGIGIKNTFICFDASISQDDFSIQANCEIENDFKKKLVSLYLEIRKYQKLTHDILVREEIEMQIDEMNIGNRYEKRLIVKKMKDISTYVALPLVFKDNLIGMVFLGSKASSKAFYDEDIVALTNFAKDFSVIVANAMIHTSKEEQARLLKREVQKQTKEIANINKELKKSLEDKTVFSHMINHQLREPLSNICNYLSLFEKGNINNMSPEKREKFIEVAIEYSNLLKKKTHDLLFFLSLEQDIDKQETHSVNLDQICLSVFNDYKDKFLERNLSIDYVKSGNSFMIKTDPMLIREAMINLFDNIYFYSASGEVEVRLAVKGGSVKLQISNPIDQKIVDEHFEEKVTERFGRGKEARKLNPTGTGLGVSIVKRIVERSGGKFEVRVNDGSFDIDLSF